MNIAKLLHDIFSLNSKCSLCDNVRLAWEKFCPHCGVPNHHFEMKALNKQYGGPGGTIEEVMTNGCHHWHTMEPECTEFRFCPICGVDKVGGGS